MSFMHEASTRLNVTTETRAAISIMRRRCHISRTAATEYLQPRMKGSIARIMGRYAGMERSIGFVREDPSLEVSRNRRAPQGHRAAYPTTDGSALRTSKKRGPLLRAECGPRPDVLNILGFGDRSEERLAFGFSVPVLARQAGRNRYQLLRRAFTSISAGASASAGS